MNVWGTMALILSFNLLACAEKNEDSTDTQETANAPIIEESSSVRLEIDATSRTEWVGIDLDQGTFISATDLPNSTSWDLALKRTSIRMQSGVGMQVVNQDFAAITERPSAPFIEDQPSTEAGAPETAGLAFHTEPAWYSYDVTTHAVSSRGLSYVIRTKEGRFFKLKILDYYNAARLPAYFNLEFQELKGAQP